MLQQIIMALGAGLASAILFVVPAKGSALAFALGLIAPLPLMIAAIGQGERIGAATGVLGAASIALVLDPRVGGFYLLTVAIPALVLCGMTRRPVLGAPGYLLLACAVFATLLAWSGVALEALTYPSLDAALEDIVNRLTPIATSILNAPENPLSGLDPREFATWVALGMTPAAAAWGVAGLAINLWLAARISAISGQLPRPWPDLPTTLRLPRWGFALLAGAVAACAIAGLGRLLASAAVAALVVAFALHGLAALHALTRGRSGRPAILVGFYTLCFALFPWPLLIAASLGLADVARPFRRAPAVSIQPK